MTKRTVTTTDYGTWRTLVDRTSLSLGQSVYESLGDYVDGYDLDAIVAEYRDAINEALPAHVCLSGDQFIGPYYEEDYDRAGYPTDEDGNLDLKEIVKGVDFWKIAQRHEKTS